MGKSIIIKGADFSAVSVDNDVVIIGTFTKTDGNRIYCDCSNYTKVKVTIKDLVTVSSWGYSISKCESRSTASTTSTALSGNITSTDDYELTWNVDAEKPTLYFNMTNASAFTIVIKSV